jgi:hypothetical protein
MGKFLLSKIMNTVLIGYRLAKIDRTDVANGFATAMSAWLRLAGPGKKHLGRTQGQN